MLQIRPNCEWCDRDLPPASPDARICSYECTYCAACVDEILENICPTCGGGFQVRPIRPKQNLREGKTLGLRHHPASEKRIHSPFTEEDVKAHVARVKTIPAGER